MKKLSALIALALAGALPLANAADSPKPDANAVWKDVANCMPAARGKVASVRAGKFGGQAGVEVKVKFDKGSKTFASTVVGARVDDFKVGTAFCAVDYTTD
ncbi:hypothetical protein [Paucibacter soli]|uniref:hypothetical protein n=1 Tax=Paucibacter soli TaxID=3133433 RepID=UPI0030B32280